jgi:hypothetical protein
MTTFKPFEYGRSLSILLSLYLYTVPEVAIREMISNSRDQYLDKRTFGTANHGKFFITIDPARKKFRGADYATGIISPDFQKFGSDTLGKSVGDRFSSVENPDEEMIGQFHLGKASYAKMSLVKEGPAVSFYSNNGIEGLILEMCMEHTELGIEPVWKDPPYRLPPKLIDQVREEKGVGLTVEIHDVVPKLLRSYYVKQVVGEQFAILIHRKIIQILLQDLSAPIPEFKPVAAADWILDCKEEKLAMDGDHVMTHCLMPEEKPPYENVRVCVKHVFIKSIHFENKVKGWLNYNRLRPNIPRDGFLDDDRYSEMLRYVTPLIDERFERLHTKKDPKLKGLNDLTKLFKDMIKNAMQLYERDPIILSGVFNELSDIKGNLLKTDEKNRKDLEKKKGPISKTGKGKESGDLEDAEGEIVIPINQKGTGVDGGGIGTKGGTKATWETDEENGREREYLTPNLNEDKDRPETGPIKPALQIIDEELGLEKPITYMPNASKLILNKSQPACYGILIMQKHYRQTSLGPFMAEALAEFITRNRPSPTAITEYRQMVNDIYTKSFFSGNE